NAAQQNQKPATKQGQPPDASATAPKPVDPKEVRAGYQKAIELGPKAVEQMERVLKSLKQKEPQAAYPPAEEARKILEEIQKAQPKQDQQDQKKQEQDKKNENQDQKKQDQKDQQNRDEQKKDQQKKDQQKQEQQKQENEKKDEEKKKQ